MSGETPVARHARPLRESDVDPNPLRQFETWIREAEQSGIRVPEAMTLATATSAGAPSARMVLLKGFDDRGFVFYSSYESRKARELAENPQAALVLYWDPLGRQVRVEGSVARTERAESEAYFETRPLGSRLGAWASRQSAVIDDREALEARLAQVEATYGEAQVPVPPFWGGYRLRPAVFEFWQNREDRLHDRLRYTPRPGGWLIERLSP